MSAWHVPEVVIDYVRSVFSTANDKVSQMMGTHPSTHEETFDQTLVAELSAAPPAFFDHERAAVVIESHWLGGRRMWGRWEIADIALLIMLRSGGRLTQRKVALLQTKRLYSRELDVEPREIDDYVIGIGRLGDKTDPIVPLTLQRKFGFDESCVYGAMSAGSDQVERIQAYEGERGVPVFYAFYNPQQLPFETVYPVLNGQKASHANALGCRVQTSDHVHQKLQSVTKGKPPSLAQLRAACPDAPDAYLASGWRLENFVADEVLRCRQGALFDETSQESLHRLFYERSAPIAAAISITIDVSEPG